MKPDKFGAAEDGGGANGAMILDEKKPIMADFAAGHIALGVS